MNSLSKFSLQIFLIFLVTVITYSSSPAKENQTEIVGNKNTKALVIGRVSQNPKKHYQHLKPIVDYVVKKLNHKTIKRGKTLFAKNNKQMVQYLKEGKVDWVPESVASAHYFHEVAGAEYSLRRWKKGVPEYYSVFFTHKESGLNDIKELLGKKFVFNDPGSTTSFFIPASILIKANYCLVHLESIKETVPDNKIGYFFSKGDELNVTTWVARKMVDAGAFSNLDWKNPDDVPVKFKKNLKIIHKSKAIPRALELFRKDLDSDLKKRIKEILLNAHKDPDGKKALLKYNGTKKFDLIDDTILKQINTFGEAYKFVQNHLKSNKCQN
jgi:phosphonate transport system substrate-binding protein